MAVLKTLQIISMVPLFYSIWFFSNTLMYDIAKLWRSQNLGGEAVEAVQKYNGLYTSCTFYPSGQEECFDIPSNEPFTFACQILMTFTSILLFLSSVLYFLGADHTAFFYKLSNAEVKKAKISLYSAILSTISCFTISTVIALYTIGVNNEQTNVILAAEAAKFNGNVGAYGTDQAIDYLYYSLVLLIIYSVLGYVANCGGLKSEVSEVKPVDGHFYGNENENNNDFGNFYEINRRVESAMPMKTRPNFTAEPVKHDYMNIKEKPFPTPINNNSGLKKLASNIFVF